MSFSSDWLALREPADHAARDAELLAGAVAVARRAAGDAPPVIVDLGCGTGATVRALAGALPEAHWRLVDADAALLAEAARRTGGTPHRLDLRTLEALPLEGAHLVTASALLDLMPRDWVAALAARLRAAGVGFYAALSYDGWMDWTPVLPLDAAVTAAFNTHQRGDKGLGAALGPDAGQIAAQVFAEHGFDVRTADSPWQLTPSEGALHAELVAGIAAAAAETGLEAAQDWGAARRTFATARIGHLDLLALP
ncbi:methyltransferase domain-containing protein [Rhodobaculum claviforme]|uniref:Methyltransferase domain-containing protein n=1 Tax=Rhodobaculum claviforme TaxID=1549854 RepID=A0A934WIB2_9RHOB|nr:class I SAM-dependent methyltransferase [Rhodobaculum claviforme]MBK5926582.1 hypothetical protein [Rhodobaculum claviforme]